MKTNKYGFKGVKLERGQIIKFGRYVFKVNEISTDKSLVKFKESKEMDMDGVLVTNNLQTIDQRDDDYMGKFVSHFMFYAYSEAIVSIISAI